MRVERNSPATSLSQACGSTHFCVLPVTMRRLGFQRHVERFKGLANEEVILPQISMNSQTNFLCSSLSVCMCVCVRAIASVGPEVMYSGLRLS